MSLDDIAEDIGTVEYEQEDAHDPFNNADSDGVDIDQQDVQNEYDGGFTVDH
jgi:hypothetical protein